MRKVVDEVCERMADLCSEIQTSGMQVENGRGIAAVVVLFPIASIDSHPVELTATDARTLWKLADGVFRDWSKTPAGPM